MDVRVHQLQDERVLKYYLNTQRVRTDGTMEFNELTAMEWNRNLLKPAAAAALDRYHVFLQQSPNAQDRRDSCLDEDGNYDIRHVSSRSGFSVF